MSLISISSVIRMRQVGGWIANESCCQPRAGSDRLDGADGRGWWAEQLWHTSMSDGRIHLIINAIQLVANKREAGGHPELLSRGRKAGANLNTNMDKCMLVHARVSVLNCTCMSEHTRHTKRPHTPRQSITYNSKLRIGVDFAVLIPSHTLVHPRVGEGQPTDWQRPVGDLYALLWT